MSKSYEQILKEQNKLSAPGLEADKKTYNTLFDNKVQTVKDTYGAEIKAIEQSYAQVKGTEKSYDDLYRENAIQRRINEHMILRDLTNTGDTNSGLSQTQMTAVQLNHANNQAKIRRQQQAGMDALSLAMAQEVSGIENDRLSTIADIERQYAENDRSVATSMYNKQLEEETAQYNAILDAQTKFDTNKKEVRTDLLSVLTDDAVDDSVKRSAFSDYLANYGIDATDVALKPYESKYNVKTTVDPVTGVATSKTSYTEDDVAKYKRLWNSRNVTKETAISKIQTFAENLGLTPQEANAFLSDVSGNTYDTTGTVNPADYEYKLIDAGDLEGTDFKEKWGVDNDEWGFALDAVVEDEFGIQRTLSDIFHNARLYYIRQEHKNDWATWSKKGTNLEDALRDDDSDAWDKAKQVVLDIIDQATS